MPVVHGLDGKHASPGPQLGRAEARLGGDHVPLEAPGDCDGHVARPDDARDVGVLAGAEDVAGSAPEGEWDNLWGLYNVTAPYQTACTLTRVKLQILRACTLFL